MTDNENPAEVLREAAALMRKRAEAATPGPWLFEPAGGSECGEPGCCTDYWDNRIWGQGDVVSESYLTGDEDSRHIASWHPAAALAVADWLDQHADYAQSLGREPGPNPLNVARTYLGSPEAA